MKALGKGSLASWIEVGLRVFSWILWIALAGVILAAVAYALVTGLVASRVLPPEILSGGKGTWTTGDADVSYSLSHGLSWQIIGPALAAAALAVSGGLIIVDRLRRLFESFRSAEPFRQENATHLRVIWMTMLGIELGRQALLGLTGVLIAVFGKPTGTKWDFSIHVSVMSWVAILILIVLAEVFREGARLREEQDLTI